MTRTRLVSPWTEHRDLEETIVAALTVVFGLQLIRTLLADLVFYLRDSVGAAPALTGVFALGIFSLAFLAPYLRHLLGPRAALLLTAGGIASIRVAEQVVRSPAADLALASLGTVLFLMFVPIFLLHPQERDQPRSGGLALGVLLGLALDTTLKGAFGTLDLSWQTGPLAMLVVALLAGVHLFLLAAMLRRGRPLSAGIGRPVLLLALGPVLFLELLLFQNIGQQTVLTGWTQPDVYLWLSVANAVGIAAGIAVMARPDYGGPLTLIALSGLFVWLVLGEPEGAAAAAMAFYGPVVLAVTVGMIGVGLRASAPTASSRTVFLFSGCGLLTLLLLTFLYYVDYAVAIPGGNRVAFLIGVAALLALVSRTLPLRLPQHSWRESWAVAVVSVLLLVFPTGYLLAWESPATAATGGYPVRVMSYNLHQGFDTEGVLDIARQADLIREQSPDIIALQEVSRGWLLDGSFDMLVWLSRELDMPYVWGPAADSAWGSAILSRYPVSESHTEPMPNNNQIAMDRSFTTARIELPGGEPLTVIASHLHHTTGQSVLREEQIRALLQSWDGGPRTVILGDFNATPETGDIQLLREAGLKDAFVAAGGDPGGGYTAPSLEPMQRIDYIWVSPDLGARDFSIFGGSASDHLGVAVTLYR